MTPVEPPGARRLFDSPIVAMLLPAILSLVWSVLPTLAGHPPRPDVQDEFAHLLAADTFAHGRLTNSPHPLWPFFEAVHLLVQPTYMSKYLPGLGLILAGGQLLGPPILGVWLTSAAACGAIAWMLLGCLPPRWALLGGLLAAGHPLLMWWSQTFWGGEVQLLGGTLLSGAAVRLLSDLPYRQRWAWLAGAGGGILLLSRPFEGAIVGLLLSTTLLLVGWREQRVRQMLRPVPIILTVLLGTAAWLAYFNWRVTGSPWQLPYTLAARQYMTAPLMYWQSVPPPPTYRDPLLAHFYRDYEWPEYARQRTPGAFAREALKKYAGLWDNYIRGWMLPLLPLLCGALLIRRQRVAAVSLLIVLGLPTLQIAMTPWMRNQYMAPAVGCLFVLIMLGYERLSRASVGGLRVGRMLIGLLLTAQVIQTGIAEWNLSRPNEDALGSVRQRWIEQLNAADARPKLVFVRHLPGGSLSDVVYNSANIDTQPIIFARDRGAAANQELLAYYPQREPWLLIFESRALSRYVTNGN